jgi:hypothetical protein
MIATVEVPSALNVILREALIDGIGDVPEDLTDLIIPLRDRVRRPDRFDGPFDRLERIRALLADLGWGDSKPSEAARIDLIEHGRALSDALDKALAVADDDLQEATTLIASGENAASRPCAPRRSVALVSSGNFAPR